MTRKEVRLLWQGMVGALLFGLVLLAQADCKPPAATSLPPAPTGQLLVVSQNMWQFHDEAKDFRYNKPVAAKRVAARVDAYADYVIRRLGAPHLLALQEVENEKLLERLVVAIRAKGGPDYQVSLLPNQDVGGNTVALLSRAPIKIGQVKALFRHQVLAGTKNSRVFTRLPLLVDIRQPLVMQVMVVHLRSGAGLTNARQRDQVMHKRRSEVQTLIRWARQQKGHYLVLGDFNTAAGTGDYAQPWTLLQRAGWLSARSSVKEDNYTYVFRCKKEQLDQVFYSPSLAPLIRDTAYAHGNAGHHRALMASQGTRILSDHDAIGVYVQVE